MNLDQETLRKSLKVAERRQKENFRQIDGLTAQVDDLKYTLHVVLQCLVASPEKPVGEDRYEALVKDARAALGAKETDYLG